MASALALEVHNYINDNKLRYVSEDVDRRSNGWKDGYTRGPLDRNT